MLLHIYTVHSVICLKQNIAKTHPFDIVNLLHIPLAIF